MLKAGIREFFAESEEIMRKERRWKKVLSAMWNCRRQYRQSAAGGKCGGNRDSRGFG